MPAALCAVFHVCVLSTSTLKPDRPAASPRGLPKIRANAALDYFGRGLRPNPSLRYRADKTLNALSSAKMQLLTNLKQFLGKGLDDEMGGGKEKSSSQSIDMVIFPTEPTIYRRMR